MGKCILRQVPSPTGGACPLQPKHSLQTEFQSARMANAGLLGESALGPGLGFGLPDLAGEGLQALADEGNRVPLPSFTECPEGDPDLR